MNSQNFRNPSCPRAFALALRVPAAAALALLVASQFQADADIISVEEVGLEGDAPAIIEPNGDGAEGVFFDEESLTFSDRTHQHNGAAFDDFSGEPGTGGAIIAGLPEYLVGNPYVRFANNARDNSGYQATITADQPSTFYLLIDNRLNGPAGNTGSPNSTDPELGGTLEWVLEGGWERVNTGISPEGLPDYTGVDESGDGFGPGEALNQFYSVYKFPTTTTSVVVGSNGVGGSNMISVVVGPAEDGELPPIASFRASPGAIAFGAASSLNFLLNPSATLAQIDREIGSVLGRLDENGSGAVEVSPAVDTTYTLEVESPAGNATAEATVTVNLLSRFETESTFIEPGTSTTLTWKVRPDATVTIEPDIGNVTASVGPDGSGTTVVSPGGATTTYVLKAKGSGREETAQVSILVQPAGQRFALLDIGALGGQVEPGATGDGQVGAAAAGTNGTNLEADDAIALVSETGDAFSVAIDNLDPEELDVGGLDWRDRGNANTEEPLAALGEDLVKNNAGMIRVTLDGLPAGTYNIMSYHLDPDFSQCEEIGILVSDAAGEARETGITGSAFVEGAIPGVAGLTAGLMNEHVAIFSITATGEDPVRIYFDGQGASDTEVPLNGLILFTEGGGGDFRITRVRRDVGAGEVQLQWLSTAGATYRLETSVALNGWLEIDDGVASGGATTDYTVSGVPVAEPERYYRVGR